MSGRRTIASGTKITKAQKYKLIEMMKESPELGYGNRTVFTASHSSRAVAEGRWKEIAKTLNSMDNTAQKEWQSWRKSWSDIRTKMRDDWSLVVKAHLNQNKRNRKTNNKIYKNDDDDHMVTVPKIEPESDDSSSGTDSDLMTNHDGPKILRKNSTNPVRFNIHHIQIDDDNESNNDDDDNDNDDNDEDKNDEDYNDDDEENDRRDVEVKQQHRSNNVQRTTRSKSNINPIIIDPPVISIKTKPPILEKQTNGINKRVKIVLKKTSENLIKNANNCSVRIKKIPNNINGKINVQNNTNEKKKKSSFTNFMKEYVERKAKVKENYYTRKLELLQRDVVAKESMASSLKILINRKRDF